YKLWLSLFNKNKCYIPERFKKNDLVFEDYRLCDGKIICFKIAMWNNFKLIDFMQKQKLLIKIRENIKNKVEKLHNVKRLFNKEVEINDWYNNIIEFYAVNISNRKMY